MPPRCQLSGTAKVRKSNKKQGQFKECYYQGVEIQESGFKVYPCQHYISKNKEYFIIPEKYEKYNTYTYYRKLYICKFHTNKE